MENGEFLTLLAARIGAATGREFRPRRSAALGGGCINNANVIEDGERRYFVKTNSASRAAMFSAEAEGLTALAQAQALRVPKPICHGTAGASAYLVLEFIALKRGDARSAEALGRGLARQHRHVAESYGFPIENTIGATPQPNTPSKSWIEFWRERRLGYQLRLAAENGYGGRMLQRGETLNARLEKIFDGHRPAPSLLHGDLWGGNHACDESGRPVVFDPATYYGDREADIAMTELFGGFPARFYAAYKDDYPLDPGYRQRRELYNLYHVLNHLNLFGGGYGAQAEHMIDHLLSEIG